MSEKARKRRDFIQNITIALLSVLMVLLFTQSQLFNMGSDYLGLLHGTDTPVASSPTGQDIPLSFPLRAAVTGPYGRFGSVAFTTADETFEPLRLLLEQALSSARTPTLCSTQVFQEALQDPSIYFDFLSPLPLPVLAESVWASSDLTTSARYLALSGQETGTTLYLWDGGTLCYRCDTALSPKDLDTTVNQYELGNARFAFEIPETGDALAPFSLLPDETPELPVLTCSSTLSDTDRLLTLLNFNPNTNYRYPESDGSETVVEGERSVRLHPDGTVIYRDRGEDVLAIDAQADQPTLKEAASGIGTLLGELLAGSSGSSELYLAEIQQSGDSTTAAFAYQVNGVPIRFSDGRFAAEVTLTGTAVSSMTLHFRQYTSAGTNSLLLPLPQATAIAARQPGRELSIGYVDNGSGTVSAGWLSDEP